MRQRAALQIACTLCCVGLATPATARAKAAAPSPWGWIDAHQPLTEVTWVTHYLLENRRVQIEDDALNSTLESFQRPWIAGVTDTARFARGRFGPNTWRSAQSLSWNDAACEPKEDSPIWNISSLVSGPPGVAEAHYTPWKSAFELVRPAPFRLLDAWLSLEQAPEPHALRMQARGICPAYKSPHQTSIVRTDGDHDKFALLECDGSVSADTMDRLSVLMRPQGVDRPALPLPDEPLNLDRGEWVPGVKLVHPRLVWALQRVAQAFPWRAIYLVSGYRRDTHGFHPKGRAVDIAVHGIDNAELFNLCRTLNDVGCGFYPNNKFVHIDVRDYGTKHPAWVDVAEPGQASVYVDTWPGIEGPAAGDTLPDH